MKRILIIVVLLIIAVGGWYAYRLYTQKTPDVVNKNPDVVITATELIAAFDKDTATAKKKYIDRIIEVTGTVKRIDTTGSVVLGEEGSASEVTISLDEQRHLNDHKKLKIGTVGILQGKCTGYSKGNGEDLLESLGTTVELNFAGVKNKQ